MSGIGFKHGVDWAAYTCVCVCLSVQRSSAYKRAWQWSGNPLSCVCVSVVSFLCLSKYHSTQHVSTYHKAVLRWGRASIALYINIMCGCSDRLYERNFRLADIYPSEVVFCFVRFNVEVLQPTFFSGSDYATGSCLCNSF